MAGAIASSEVDVSFTKALPKAELHAHLTGSISSKTLHDIWTRKQSQNKCLHLQDPLEVIRAGSDGFVDVATFFPLFDSYIYSLCNDVESVEYATREVLRDFKDDGVDLLELRTTPRAFAETGMSKEDYVKAVIGVLDHWNQSFANEVEVYLILSVDRRMTAEQAMEVVDLAIKYRSCESAPGGPIVAVDLAGNPIKGDVSLFTPAFKKAKANGLCITAHFAEVPQSSSHEELNTILSWQPDRLGHCIHVSPKIQQIMLERSLGVELCLSCNVLAGLTSGGFNQHVLGEWLQRDCPIALSTDDVGIFGSQLSNEYALAAEHFSLSKVDLIKLSKSAVSVAFGENGRMIERLEEFERAMAAE